jgi:hypothetical protein
MTDPAVLSLAPRPKAEDQVRESIVAILATALKEARNGEITSVIMILQHSDGDWSDRASETIKFTEAIGRLEILKQEWIAVYLADRDQ